MFVPIASKHARKQGRFRVVRTFALAAAVALVTIPAAARSAGYAAAAWEILPPGQSGDLLFPRRLRTS
jgi:hypothetical protein